MACGIVCAGRSVRKPIHQPPFIIMKAANESKDKTTAPNQLWQTDFTYGSNPMPRRPDRAFPMTRSPPPEKMRAFLAAQTWNQVRSVDRQDLTRHELRSGTI